VRRLQLRLLESLQLQQLDLGLREVDAPLCGDLGRLARVGQLLRVLTAPVRGAAARVGRFGQLLHPPDELPV
jgi:hypothetical protein